MNTLRTSDAEMLANLVKDAIRFCDIRKSEPEFKGLLVQGTAYKEDFLNLLEEKRNGACFKVTEDANYSRFGNPFDSDFSRQAYARFYIIDLDAMFKPREKSASTQIRIA